MTVRPIPYVQSSASQEVPPPYHFPGVTVQGFVCEVAIDAAQAYCDKFFNLGDPKARGFKYSAVPTWPYALLLMIDYPVMITSSRKPENIGGETQYSERGTVSQQEVFLAIPVLRTGLTPATALTHTTLEWMLPFITVGNPTSAVCGREMLGLEKLRAEIAFGENVYPDSFKGQVNLPGWTSMSMHAGQRMLRFLDVTTGPPTPTFRGAPRESSLWTLFRNPVFSSLIDGMATAADLIDNVSVGLVPTTMQTVSLKQFRDARQPERALYQALISCRTKYSSITNFRFYKEQDVDIRFHDQASFQEITDLLRLAPQPSAVSDLTRAVHPIAAYRFNATIDFDQMRTLHTFPVDRGALPPTPASSDLVAPWLRPWAGFFGPRRTS